MAGGASHALDGKGLGMEFRGRCVWSAVRQVGRCPGRAQSKAGGAADRSPRLPGIEAPRRRLGTGGWGPGHVNREQQEDAPDFASETRALRVFATEATGQSSD